MSALTMGRSWSPWLGAGGQKKAKVAKALGWETGATTSRITSSFWSGESGDRGGDQGARWEDSDPNCGGARSEVVGAWPTLRTQWVGRSE